MKCPKHYLYNNKLGKAIQEGRGYSYPEGTWIPLSKRYMDTLTQDGKWILLG